MGTVMMPRRAGNPRIGIIKRKTQNIRLKPPPPSTGRPGNVREQLKDEARSPFESGFPAHALTG